MSAILSDAELAARFAAIAGAAHVITDPAECLYYSRDFFYWDDAGRACLVVAPETVAQLQAIMQLLAGQGRELAIRGGGMSTGRSYVPNSQNAILLDMRRINRIREVNVADRYLVAEAGCNWSQVLQALAPHGLVCDFTIPGSGNVATVGGAMAHNVAGGMKGVLGMEAVRANGELIRTGAWARATHGAPYYRDYGPDLTGLFLGDTGAFAIKTAVALHLSQPPGASQFASFAFDSEQALTAALIALAPYDFITMRSGFDPYLTNLVMQARMGAGAPATQDWSLLLRCDQFTESGAQAGLAFARQICLKTGREISPALAAAMGANYLSVRGCLSATGDRWIATNAIFPLSRAQEATQAVRDFILSREEEFRAHQIKTASFITANPYHFQLEPLFWWPDKVSELALRHIAPDEAAQFSTIAENPGARAAIIAARYGLRDLLQALGAVHVHTAKFFKYSELLVPGTQGLLRDIKGALDPEHILNPGNLGV